jgi:hypothetical protein
MLKTDTWNIILKDQTLGVGTTVGVSTGAEGEVGEGDSIARGGIDAACKFFIIMVKKKRHKFYIKIKTTQKIKKKKTNIYNMHADINLNA